MNKMTMNDASIQDLVNQSFTVIAPFWPLKNLIAVNPLQGFEKLPIEEALDKASHYFQRHDLPQPMQNINRESMKWLQVYCDEGQASITMPCREKGLYPAWKQLALYDRKLHKNNQASREWLKKLSDNSEEAIQTALDFLEINDSDKLVFIELLLTTLSGWSSYVKYQTEWTDLSSVSTYRVSQVDYIAMRLIITCLIWPQAKHLLSWHREASIKTKKIQLANIEALEKNYHLSLLKKVSREVKETRKTIKAQLVFCIDVRSEPFRKAIESVGDYETFGFAGFFGVPVKITRPTNDETYSSCPVLLCPKHSVNEYVTGSRKKIEKNRRFYTLLNKTKQLYQSLKYTFTAPFGLVESLGMLSGVVMGLRNFFPHWISAIHPSNIVTKNLAIEPCISNISFDEQCTYAETVLKMMGLTSHFASLVVFCGHGSHTENNSHASLLDCGACGGRSGGSNARIIAKILNDESVRVWLLQKDIIIPPSTYFIAAEHNTTTDDFQLYPNPCVSDSDLNNLQQDLEKARHIQCAKRLKKMEKNINAKTACDKTELRSQDWSQLRPEWGLARNAAFIIGPRSLTQELDLDGRAFLHSYRWEEDPDGSLLTTILTAPVVVAQWINCQYFFSTLDNVAFGGGNKITQNITGKIAIMQGNASDIMTGLPLQSVYASDTHPYHEPLRLMSIVFAPQTRVNSIIEKEPLLQKLLGNGWLKLACLNPDNYQFSILQRDLSWQNSSE